MTRSNMLALRDYQEHAIKSIFKAWTEEVQRPAVVLPTGAGKTVVFSHLTHQFMDWRTAGNGDALGSRRVMILVHRDELADQTLAKLSVIAPGLRSGKVKAENNDVTADVMVCSVQTLARRERLQQLRDAETYAGHVGLVIVDECHHAVAPTYQNILHTMGCFSTETDVMAAGFTATMQRGDMQGLGDTWEDVVFTRSILWMIARGYLVDVRARQVEIADLNLGKVKRSGGDYTASSLGEAMEAAGAPEIIRQVIRKQAADRRSILVFTPTVALAQETADTLRADGVTAAVVHGGTPREERLLTYKQFASGDLRVIVNCMVLTEGADFPYADCAVIARPTRNETLFIQMVGRVLRPSPATGKADALVLLLSGEGGSIRTLVDLSPIDVPEIDDGESLTEAYEREEARKETVAPAGSVRFELKHRDLDLFKSSPAYQWLRTTAGVQFIPLGGNGEIVIWPCKDTDGLWDVVWAPEGRAPWQRLHMCLDLSMAMAWGESEAEERSAINTGKSASWRKKRPSEAQMGFAARLGCTVPADARAGDVGDLISAALASKRIDKFARHL